MLHLSPSSLLLTTLFSLFCAKAVNGQQKVFYDGEATYTYNVGAASDISIENDVAYVCSIVNQWTMIRQPKFYPRGQARWGIPVFVAHSDAYTMWEPDMFATPGVKSLAEEGKALTLKNEITAIDDATNIPRFGDKLMISETERETVKQIYVSKGTPYLSTIVRAFPSPCWFSGFYKMDLRSTADSTKWLQSVTIQSFPWNAGTTPGVGYLDTAAAESLNAKPIKQMTPSNIDQSQAPWLTMSLDDVLPVLIWECTIGSVTNTAPGTANGASTISNNGNTGRVENASGGNDDPDSAGSTNNNGGSSSEASSLSLSLFALFYVTMVVAVMQVIKF